MHIFLYFPMAGNVKKKKIYMMRRNIFLKVLQCVKLKKKNFHKFIWGIPEKKKVYTYLKVFFQLLKKK